MIMLKANLLTITDFVSTKTDPKSYKNPKKKYLELDQVKVYRIITCVPMK